MTDLGNLAAGEFKWVELGDKRLNERAGKIAGKLAEMPAATFPKALSEAELTAYYRFVNHETVTFESLLDSHVESTKRRVEGFRRIIVAHDTTDFRFKDEEIREGLGPMDNGGQGFYAHVSLAFDSARQPLGTLAVEPWTREAKDPKAPKPTKKERYESPDKESLRWLRAVGKVEKQLAGQDCEVIHVMDREADDYHLLAALLGQEHRFVIRSSTDRLLSQENPGENAEKKLRSFARQFEVRFERSAELAHRKKKRPAKQVKTFPPRKARTAQLSFSAGPVTLRRPDAANKNLPCALALNLVHVVELNPPEDAQPVEWFLLTNQPIDTGEQIARVVDDYRARWSIEEFFKALKTGCGYEQRQHESKHALLNALAIFLTIAWQLLLLRHISRASETRDLPASEFLTPTQIQIIRAKSEGRLGPSPCVRDAVLALARFFGGHLKSNGEPGWQVLGRAYESLLAHEYGWRLAIQASYIHTESI
jgi:hypothetical protein